MVQCFFLRSRSTGGLHRAFPQGAFLSRPLDPYHSICYCPVLPVLEVLQKLPPTVRVEGTQELRFATGHKLYAHYSDASVVSARLIFQAGLSTDPLIYFAVQHPHPPALLLRLLFLEGPLLQPSLPTNCLLHPLFRLSYLRLPQS